jgi:hypothetical protein
MQASGQHLPKKSVPPAAMPLHHSAACPSSRSCIARSRWRFAIPLVTAGPISPHHPNRQGPLRGTLPVPCDEKLFGVGGAYWGIQTASASAPSTPAAATSPALDGDAANSTTVIAPAPSPEPSPQPGKGRRCCAQIIHLPRGCPALQLKMHAHAYRFSRRRANRAGSWTQC